MKALLPLMLISLISCQEGSVETVAKKSVNTSEPYTFITDAEDPKPPVADPLSGYPDALSYNNQVSMNETYLDYLIMDVCVDSSNRIIKGDPATCPKRRNIRIGERLPYLLTDFDRANSARYQALSSLPMVGTDGKLKVMVTKH